jgi:hypothetical protein
MRIFLTTTEPENPLVIGLLPQMGTALAALEPRYTAVESASTAEAILFVESASDKFASFQGLLRGRREIVEFPSRCFVYDVTDVAASFLPGLYAAIPKARFNASSMRAMPAWDDTPDSVFQEAVARATISKYLFSFRGSRSSAVRAELFAMPFGHERCSITETHHWWNFDPRGQVRLDYLTEISSTLFPLAPRGLGTTTLRLYEIMRLGRAPVILSDEWVPPAGIPWGEFSIRLDESRIRELPAILSAFEPWAEEMGDNARSAWEKWCRPGPALMRYLAHSLEELILLRHQDFDGHAMTAEWSTQRFKWNHGWHPVQRVARSIRRRTLVPDVLRVLRGPP